tara:strand:- start:8724 stop:10421 length:1698 start_codon:yes stop_codon:yes gene_type:complete
MPSLQTDHIDPITLEIIQNSLTAIADEMFAAMALAAMSSVIYEVLDFGVAITDADGELASAGAGIPSFVGMLDPSVKAIIHKYKERGFRPGDVFIANDPFTGGVSHANDVVLAMPVFHDGEIIAWTANKGHWVDIGGMTPGSLSPLATELFQEGLILPEIRLFDGGRPVEAVFDIIRANSRLPDQATGDLWAGISALRIGAQRLEDLCRKYGQKTVRQAIRRYLEYGEMVARHGLRKLPKGCFEAEDKLDDGRKIRAVVTITDDEFIVDLRDNPPQDEGPVNASYYATLVSAQAVFKGVAAPERWANAGSFRPLKLMTTPGTLFHAERPAAVGLYYENKIRSADLICKALAPHMPDRMPAGHFASICATLIRSRDAEGREHTFIEPEIGGWGAGASKDGENAQFSASHGDTFTCPVEVNEARNGITVERLALNDEPAGPGRYRGGKGIDLRYKILGERAWLTAGYTRTRIPPWGVKGGGEGSLNRLEILHADGTTECLDHASNRPLEQGDIVRIVTGNGGGFGDPRTRPASEVLADLKNGYITRREAIDLYGLDSTLLDQEGKTG